MFFISKCSGDIIITYMEVKRHFLYKNGLNKNVCNVIRFRENKKYRKHVRGDEIQNALSPSIAIFFIDF